MRALVTGAGGFIGRILCLMLRQEGWEITAVDLRPHPIWKNITNDYWVGSYGDPELFRKEYDMIFHLGASSTLGPSVKDPIGYMRNNVSNLIRMLQFNVRNTPIVFASSAATYGDPGKDIALREEHAGSPCNPYGMTKWMGELAIEQACLGLGLKAYAMRFFNVAGSYAGLGQDLDQPHILTKMGVARQRGEVFRVHGNKYDTYDGTCVRDYVHVVDVCDALIKAAHQLIKDPDGSFTEYNVCTMDKTSNLQLASIFNDMFALDFDVSDVRPGDPGYLYGDNTNIKRELNWQPKFDVYDIIESHFHHVRNEFNAN